MGHIEQALDHLYEQVQSLAEVVIQNRRGLDQLFMSQGELCVALREACCFYANESGVIKSSLAKVKENIHRRDQKLGQNESWFQRWYDWNPWLTTLLTGLAGRAVQCL